jgi:hypothetical protein
MNAADNQTALNLLKSGFKGATVRYLEAGHTFADAADIKGLSAQIMGPPRDPKFLARMDPPKGDRFLHMGTNTAAGDVVPFPPKWKVRPKRPPLTPNDLKALKDAALNVNALAFALDQILNNTSVVACFTYRHKTLLFPGDAQYGNWQSWMDTPEGESIFEHVDFFKIAHHGSLNATPKSALEKMHDGFAAMISTQSKPWPSIPFAKMLVRLDKKAKSGVVRSDSIPLANAPAKLPQGPKLALSRGFEVGPFWCDYRIAV